MRIAIAAIIVLAGSCAHAEQIVLGSDARAGCLAAFAEPIVGTPCVFEGFGDIAKLESRSFAYALYRFAMPNGGSLGARVLIFERQQGGTLRILFAPEIEGGPFEKPKIIHSGASALLHIPGYETGTGNFNRERLFVWHRHAWRAVDTTSWLDTLQRRLPKGLGAWKGIYPDYRRMTAATPLWREGDGNASPTGGRAALRLELRGDRIVLKSARVRRR